MTIRVEVETLSDHSHAFNVVLCQDNQRIVLPCTNEKGAETLKELLLKAVGRFSVEELTR